MQGLFNKKLTYPESDGTFAINVVDSSLDMLLHVNSNCDRFEDIQAAASSDPEVRQMRAGIDADNERDFFPRLRAMTNMTDATTEELNDVCNYLYWALLNNLDLIFGSQLTTDDRNRIKVTVNANVYEKYKAQEELQAFPSFEIFSQFSEFVRIVEDGEPWQQMPFFTKYFSA